MTEAGELLDDSIPDAELTTEALAAADQYDHPVYDLLYAVIARRYGCTVLTRDKRLGGLLRLMDIPVLAS